MFIVSGLIRQRLNVKCKMTLCKEKIIAVRTNDMYDESNI